MKRRSFFFAGALLGMFLLFSSCSGRETSSPAKSAPPAVAWRMATDTDGYAHCATDTGYFECIGGKLFYTDYASQKKVVLCSRPECTHSDSSCPGFLGRYAVPFFVGEKFYLFYPNLSGKEENETACIIELDLAGGERKTIKAFDPAEDLIYGILTDGKRLYYNLVQVTDNGTNTPDATYLTQSMDLVSGETKDLKQSSDVEYIMGAIGESLILKTIEIPDSSDSGLSQNPIMKVFLYSLSDGARQDLLQYEGDELSCYIAFPLLFEYDFESSRFSVRDLSTGTHRVICESLELQGGVSPAIVKVLDDYVIFESLSDSSDETLRWAVSVETGQCYPLYLTYDLTFRGDAHHYFFNVLAETEDSYLVEVGGERVLYTDTLADGSKLQAEGYDMLYALMKKQDYVNNDSTKMQPIENVDSRYSS